MHPLNVDIIICHTGFDEAYKKIKETLEQADSLDRIKLIVIESNIGQGGHEEANEAVLRYLAERYPDAYFCIKGSTECSLVAAQNCLIKRLPEAHVYVCPYGQAKVFMQCVEEVCAFCSKEEPTTSAAKPK